MSTPKVQSFRERIARIEGDLLELVFMAEASVEAPVEGAPSQSARGRRSRPVARKAGER